MSDTSPKQSLNDSITRLIAAYQQAMDQSDQSDFITKAEVTRSVIDSGRAIANRLRTRQQGADKLVQKLENYYQALRAEDWVEKSKSGITTAAAIMGITAGTMIAFGLNMLWAVFEGSAFIGLNLPRYIIAYPVLLRFLYSVLKSAYDDFSRAENNPSMANIIMSRTVDPAERQVYALIGGSRPARTFETINKVGAIAGGVIVFVFACGIVYGVLQAF